MFISHTYLRHVCQDIYKISTVRKALTNATKMLMNRCDWDHNDLHDKN